MPYIVNGVSVSKEEYDRLNAQFAAEDVRAAKASEAAKKAFLGENLGAIAPNPQSLDNAIESVTAAAPPVSQKEFNGPGTSGVIPALSPNVQNYPNPANSSFDARLNSLGLNWNPQPNPLNVYANYTYHIRWFMTSEAESYNNVDPANPNSNNMAKTVIVESGVTAGFNIVELRSTAYASANTSRRNMWSSVEFDMVISEPLGLNLMDKIYFSSKQIGVINHARCPYFLEIWFTGYDEDGTIVAPGLFYQMYRVKIQTMEVSATQVGSTYNIHLYVDNTFGEMNQSAISHAGFNVKATTLGQFLDGYIAALNKQQIDLNNDSVQQYHYKIVYPDIWKNWNIRPADTDKHVSRSGEMSIQSSDLKDRTVITINRGQAVENVVNFAVYLCKDAQDWITGDNGAGGGGATLTEEALVGYVSVYPMCKIIGFDPVTRDYIYEITYVLSRTESARAYTDMQSVKLAQLPNTQLSKLKYMIQNNRLVKRYDYIWTGLNTEVVSFDIKMDLTWAINLPTWNQGNSYYQYATPALVNQESQDNLRQRGLQPKDQTPPGANQAALLDRQLGADGLANSSTNVGQPVGPAPSALQQIQVGNTAANQAATNIPPTSSTASTANDRVILFNQSSGQLALTAAQSKVPGTQQLAASMNNYLTTRAATLSTTYIEDTKNNSELFSQPPLPVVGMYDTLPTAQNATQNTDQAKTTNIRDPQAFAPGVGFVGAVLGNVFGDQKPFQDIELTIRGDPWWMPVSNMLQDIKIMSYVNNAGSNNASSTQLFADYLGGDNSFLLQFKTGIVIDEDTGFAKDDSNGGADFFTGIYLVRKVTNVFSHGKFTQILAANKDILAQNPIEYTTANNNRDRQN